MSKKKKMPLGGLTVALLSASVVLLAGSTIGSARAALTYYSENYGAQVEVSNIGVSLVENDKVVSSRDYVSNNEWKGTSEGELLTDLLGKDDTFTPGKKYNEAISVKNSGTIDTFVRVIITKSWQDKEGKKNTTLSPDLIELNFLTDCKRTVYERAYRSLLYKGSCSRRYHTGIIGYTPHQSFDCIGCNKTCNRI